MRDRLIEMIQNSVGGCARHWAEIIADHLLANGVILLPCKVGSTLYRIDYREQRCSPENVSYDQYYCRECQHLEFGFCDYRRKVPYIYEMRNATAQTILGNEHLFGTRVFLTREEAEKALKGGEGDG